MKTSKFTESQIIFAIKQSESRVKTEEICRKMGISQATFFNWKKKFGVKSGKGLLFCDKLKIEF